VIAGPVVFLLALAVSLPLLRKRRAALQAHRRTVVAASILLAGAAMLTLTVSVIAGGWAEADGGHACSDYFPSPALMPEGTGYNAKPTLLPVGVQCTFITPDGRNLSVGPTNWWLSLPALTAVAAGAVAVSALLAATSKRAAGTDKVQ